MKRSFFILSILGTLVFFSCSKHGDAPAGLSGGTGGGTTSSGITTISGISPDTGVAGTIVTLKGTYLPTSGATININGRQARILVATSDSILLVIPDRAGRGILTLRTNTNTITGPIFKYRYIVYVTTLAGTQAAGHADGTGIKASFSNPFGLTSDKAGNLYVADNLNNEIRKITPDGVVTTLSGAITTGLINGPAASARFFNPIATAFDSKGNLYILDQQNFCIRKITPDNSVSTFAGDGTFGELDGPSATAEISPALGLTCDSKDNLYFVEPGNDHIRKVTPDGTISTIAKGGPGFANGNALTAAQFNSPSGVAFDTAGNCYIADTYNYSIRKLTPAGTVSTFAGNGTSGNVNGPAASATFGLPSALVIGPDGTLYVLDKTNYSIRTISPDGTVATLTGNGIQAYNDGPAATASFYNPISMAIDPQGNLYVTDNNRIRKIIIK